MYYSTTYDSPIGLITLACDQNNLVGLWLEGQKYFGASILENASPYDKAEVFKTTKNWLDRYFSGENPSISSLPLKPVGTDFQQEVWRILCDIPYGSTMTYKDIAQEIAKRLNKSTMSSQAIGGAVGHNPITLIIPCHRVVGTAGNLTGYAGGINRKIHLLKHEGVNTDTFFIPKSGTAL